MSIFEAITLVFALIGAILGLFNTWIQLSKERVKLVVMPKHAILMGGAPGQIQFCVEVINLSSFPITVSEVGFFYRGTDKRSVISPITSDGGPFPRRLEPRRAVSLYSERPRSLINDNKIKCAFAMTDCGVICTGTSPALRQLANAI